MQKQTIDRIVNNAPTNTVIGACTYKFDVNTGEIMRCKTEDLGREWISSDGERKDGWKTVAFL